MQLVIKPILSFALFIALLGAANGQPTNPLAIQSSAEPPKELIELRRTGYAANYNLDYTTARTKFEEIRKRWPQHPAGDLYVANIIWLEHLYKLRRLQTGLYQNESFYAGFEGSKEEIALIILLDEHINHRASHLITEAKKINSAKNAESYIIQIIVWVIIVAAINYFRS